MKSFLEGMNLPRLVMLLGFLSSAVLAYFDYDMGMKLKELRRQEQDLAPMVVRKVQSHSIRLTQLQGLLAGEQWDGQNNPGSYARTIAQDELVDLGQIDVTPNNSRGAQVAKGVIDKKYTIRPVSKDRGWSKAQLGNFLFLLEERSSRVRVTRVKIMAPAKSRSKPHEIPPDEWTYEVEITSRQRE